MRNLILFLCLFSFSIAYSQITITGKVIDKSSNTSLPFTTIKYNKEYALSDMNGDFVLTIPNQQSTAITFSYLGYSSTTITTALKSQKNIQVFLSPKQENLDAVNIQAAENSAKTLIQKAIAKKTANDPHSSLKSYSYKSYNKFKITEENTVALETQDTADADIESIFNEAHSFLSEKISEHKFQAKKGEQETVLASQMTGFDHPIYDVLGITIQSNTVYQKDYVIFDNQYIGPLSKKALQNYYYKVLDTTTTQRPAYVVLFQPRKSKAFARLEGVLYLDTETLAVQKAKIELKGELNITAHHNFTYYSKENTWFPKSHEIIIRPGLGKQKVALFGGSISVGRLSKNKKQPSKNDEFLISKTDYFDIELNAPVSLRKSNVAIQIHPDANNKSPNFWKKYRTTAITEKDLKTFPVIDSIVDAQNIERRINVIQHFNVGYYPVSFFDFDLRYPIKYNNYEGLRLGLGGLTNEKLSKRFRLEGYTVYGFKDAKFKYSAGAGVLLNKNTGTWFNINYTKDLNEVGSFNYLTDKRVYSLFEPRLVNIDFYYKHRTWKASLQHRLTPELLTETQFAVSNINQTGNYTYTLGDVEYSSYKLSEATFSLRWSPFSKYLKTPNSLKEIHDGYPKISAQFTQGLSGVFDSNFRYSKIGVKIEHTVKRLDESHTNFLFEADWSTGDIPLTHLYHAYPNSPTKETVLQRFSVAGRRGFETMYFSEFFSDRLATLQIRHNLRPFKIASWFKPELVLINRYALGDVLNVQNHNGVNFNSLNHLYQESGFEINKIFAGFGLSFAYRYGAYHLPNFSDNLAFKFTFYLKL